MKYIKIEISTDCEAQFSYDLITDIKTQQARPKKKKICIFKILQRDQLEIILFLLGVICLQLRLTASALKVLLVHRD